MIINSQGFGHFTKNINNQDCGMETPCMLLVLDGCSDAECSEAGVKMFKEIFQKIEECDNHEKFEENVKRVFDEIIGMWRKYYSTDEEFESEFIMRYLLFTIIACYKLEDKYIVKFFGDGYIVTQNEDKLLSYMKFSYGAAPPYFAYKYCKDPVFKRFEDYQFKTFEFDKNIFPSVGIATDGIMPIVKGEVDGADVSILKASELMIKMSIQGNRTSFFDDVTIALFEGGQK